VPIVVFKGWAAEPYEPGSRMTSLPVGALLIAVPIRQGCAKEQATPLPVGLAYRTASSVPAWADPLATACAATSVAAIRAKRPKPGLIMTADRTP
jgi:hypothetical protein